MVSPPPSPDSDKLGDLVIVILINLPYFERFRQAYSSSVAFIRGQCNFLPSTTYQKRRKPNYDGNYRMQPFKGTPVGIHEKCMSGNYTWTLP